MGTLITLERKFEFKVFKVRKTFDREREREKLGKRRCFFLINRIEIHLRIKNNWFNC